MKIILGINTNHADSSACLVIDGKLIAAIEEERLNRIKHYSGYPINSIKECMHIANINETQITDIAFNTNPLSNILPKAYFFLKNLKIKNNLFARRFKKKIQAKKELLNNFNFNKNIKIHYIEHHLAHIASAFYPSKFKEANGLSIDGSGDFVTLATAECKNNRIKINKKIFFPHSLGIFYHAMTQFLGFNNYGDEYKVMGLAPYGKPIYFDRLIKNLFTFDNNFEFKLNLDFFNHHKNNFKYIADGNLEIDEIFSSKLNYLFSNELKDKKNIENFKKDIAASVQKIYEHFFSHTLNYLSKKNFSNNLVFSGGCALNSSANRLLTQNKKYFNNVFINYAPGDNGGAIGAAYVVASKYNLNIINSKSPFIGKNYSDDEIYKSIEKKEYKKKISYKHFSNDTELYKYTAGKIAEAKVIGWFQGKMEFGPRALGNRSILADPRNPDMKNIINKKIKRRESFRPFAPTVLEDLQTDWFESNFSSEYMSTVAKVKELKQKLVPAITHVDSTARVQTVNFETNFKYASLIGEFYKLTNVPILLNTSFNENEPMIMKPEEGLNCLLRTDLDLLIMNNFVIRKAN